MIGVTLLLLSACDFSGCKAVVAEEQSLFQEWNQLRKQEMERRKDELARLNEQKRILDENRKKQVAECLLDPKSYFSFSSNKKVVDFYGGYDAYVRKRGIVALCSALVGLGPQVVNYIYPNNDARDYAPAVAKYVLSKRVIVNNPKCFSATEVATAQEEIRRLTDE